MVFMLCVSINSEKAEAKMRLMEVFSPQMRLYFRKVGIIRKNARTFAFTGHMIHLSVGTGSLGHDAAGAIEVLLQCMIFSKAEQEVFSQFFCEIADYHLSEVISYVAATTCHILLFQHSSHSSPTLTSISNYDNKCSCCNGNEPAKI